LKEKKLKMFVLFFGYPAYPVFNSVQLAVAVGRKKQKKSD